LANCLGRLSSPVKPATALQGSGLSSGQLPQSFLAVILSDSMKAELDKQLAQAEQQPGMAANAAKCFKGLSGASLTVDMGAAMALNLHVSLASAEQAETAKNLFDNVALSGIKMGASMLTGGQTLPVLETLAATTSGSVASVSATLTEADMDMLQQIAKEKAGQQAGAMPPPQPAP
jgi:hypothetical protein